MPKEKLPEIDKKNFPYKLVLVAWEDIVSSSDWENINKIKKAKTAICYSVGWLMAETSKITVIMSDLSFEDNHEIEQGGNYRRNLWQKRKEKKEQFKGSLKISERYMKRKKIY